MLMKNECSVVASIKVKLTFDDGTVKERVISTNDLVEVVYNANGLRKHIVGKVVKVSVVGTDPKGWYIIVDGSDDFESEKARFSPTAILDIDIIRKAYTLDSIQTPLDDTGIPYMRVKNGRYLQISRDGVHWATILDCKQHHHHHHIKPAVNPHELPDEPDKGTYSAPEPDNDDITTDDIFGNNNSNSDDDVYGIEDAEY